jgi:hypothetical protein
MSGMLYPPLPQIGTRTFWFCAKVQGSETSGQIIMNGRTPFRETNFDLTHYRITKIRYSGNWSQYDYQRVIANRTLETSYTTYGNIVDQYGRQLLSDQFDMSEYFELDWCTYWNNISIPNQLFFQYNINFVPDPEILQEYGGVFEARLFIQLQAFNDDKWIAAIDGGKI